MAIEKNNFKASWFDSDCSPGSRDNMSGDEDEFHIRASGVESEEDDDFDDADSGAGSDDFDLLELGETGAEFCQVGNSTCSIPFELYDLPNLEDVLSVDAWNECLTEEERLGLAKFLPDIDQETYMVTLMELFKGSNFHFGSPLKKLFDMLKGGLCEPRVALYREGSNFFEKRKHYHFLKKHQNGLVSSLCQIRDAWHNCRGYSIEEKLRVLNIVKSQKSLMGEKEDMQSDSSGREELLGERLWNRKLKERKLGQIMGPTSVYGAGVDMDPSFVSEPFSRYQMQSSEGVLKLGSMKTHSARQLVSCLPTHNPFSDSKSYPYSSLTLPRQAKVARHQMAEFEDPPFGQGSRRDQIAHRRYSKNSDFFGSEGMATDDFVGLPVSSKGDLVYGRKKHSNESLDMNMVKAKRPNVRPSYDYMKKAKFPEIGQALDSEVQMKSMKGLKGNRGGARDLDESFLHNQTEREDIYMDPQFHLDDWNPRSKKLKLSKESALNVKSHRASLPQASNRLMNSDVKVRGSLMKKGTPNNMVLNGDATESDSSDSLSDDESNPLIRSKFAYPSGFTEVTPVKPSVDVKKGKSAKKVKKVSNFSAGALQSNEKMDDVSEHVYPPEEGEAEEEVRPVKGKKKLKKGKSPVQTSTRVKEGNFLYGSATDERKRAHKLHKKDHLLEVGPSEEVPVSPLRTEEIEDKKPEVSGHGHAVVEEDGPIEKTLVPDEKRSSKRRKKGKIIEKPDAALSGRSLGKRKRKPKSVDVADTDGGGNYLQADHDQQIEESGLLEKQIEDETSQVPMIDMGVADMELENGPPPKKAFILITPTVHTDFSFSIIHLLSAVRVAMISPSPEDSLETGPRIQDSGIEEESSFPKNADAASTSDGDPESNGSGPSITIQEIVNRVRSNPGDPCILETPEPLQDLVRGALKIFSSKSAPLGAKGWKTLVVYERSKKGWQWIGPVPHNSSDHEPIEEVTSPEAWGLPHKMMVKLVDSFANWLKSGQEILQQIGSLPPPPLALMQCYVDEKERFRDLKAQKSLGTITPSSEEVREYFRKEEFLRYSIPDRAFAYTAADGRKSIVAPLRRCGGKPTSKARDHFMLKRDRPPHVTILCLVRDAASRLPGSIGTRADVCTLIRDSQYVVEDVTDVQINQIVSGALDRLHYERDPCVQFDAERKLWKYLHREKEEEDFEDDGTSSTKKWRRPKKDAAEPSDQGGGVTVAYLGEQNEFGMCSDLNIEPALIGDDKAMETAMADILLGENNAGDVCNNGAEHIGIHQDQPMAWEAYNLNPLRENKLLCQENSTNEEFDDEAFGREQQPVGILNAGFL